MKPYSRIFGENIAKVEVSGIRSSTTISAFRFMTLENFNSLLILISSSIKWKQKSFLPYKIVPKTN
jgi:hypothetical protein